MIDFVYDEARFDKGLDPYVPAGVWVVTPTGFDFAYLPGFEERDDEVNWMLNDWVEQGIKPWLNEGFLEYWQESRSLYRGTFGEIDDTYQYEKSCECILAVLDKLAD
jgi:hypothetical protein